MYVFALSEIIVTLVGSSVELSLFYDKEKRDEARGSKYIQAELKNSYRNLIDALRKNQDKKALVFGTGCQIAGLDLLLKKLHLRDRVLLIDLICHGAASSRLWKEYASKLEREQGAKISYITFKNKRIIRIENALKILKK